LQTFGTLGTYSLWDKWVAGTPLLLHFQEKLDEGFSTAGNKHVKHKLNLKFKQKCHMFVVLLIGIFKTSHFTFINVTIWHWSAKPTCHLRYHFCWLYLISWDTTIVEMVLSDNRAHVIHVKTWRIRFIHRGCTPLSSKTPMCEILIF
jgi:hypothetical protein